MNTQQHKHGERVFCWSQSMFGSGSKIWGTVRQCSKYKWVDLDNSVGSNQNRVRYDRAYWYSQDDWDLECQQIREMRENDKRKEEEEKIKDAERYQEVTANLVKLTEIKVGQKIRFVSKNCPDMHFVYIVTEIRNNTIFGLDSDNCEVSVGRVGEVYFAVEEPIDNTTVKTVKEIKPQNKVSKLQAKLTRLNAQLSITKGNRAKVKLVLEILKVESVIEQLEPIQEKPVEVKEKEIEVKDIIVKLPVSVSTLKKHCKVPSSKLTDKEIINGWKYSLAAQSMQRDFRTQKDIQWGDRHLLLKIVYFVDQYQQEMDKRGLTEKYCLWIEKKQAFKDEVYKKPVDAPVAKKDEFCKKAEKATIKFLESKFKDAQIDITDKQIILKSETSELKLNCFVEIPYIDEYYNHYRRKKLIKRLRDGQTSKAHSVCEYIGSILLAA